MGGRATANSRTEEAEDCVSAGSGQQGKGGSADIGGAFGGDGEKTLGKVEMHRMSVVTKSPNRMMPVQAFLGARGSDLSTGADEPGQD